MQRRWVIGSLALGLWCAGMASAFGQGRRSHDETAAVGLEAGAWVPHHAEFDVAPFFEGFFEYHPDRHLMIRPALGWAEASHTGQRVDAVRLATLRVDVNYIWNATPWRPFAGAGIGAYFMQAKRDGVSFGESETKPGLSLGGGVEYVFHRAVGLRGEVRYHEILRTFTGLDPSGLTLTGGIVAYF
jgi:opacity protein-like surface antigen